MKIGQALRSILVILIAIISVPVNLIAFGIVVLRILYYLAREKPLVAEKVLLDWNRMAKDRDTKFMSYIHTGKFVF